MIPNKLIPKHGGYRRLKGFQVAQLVYDLTARFCDRYIDRFSRTRDQMVQAARSGVQNIAEGSQASPTSRKTEIKLTQVARASLEELRLDYEDFLRQRGLPMLEPNHPALMRFKQQKPQSVQEFAVWVASERKRSMDGGRGVNTDEGNTDEHGPARTNTDSVDNPPSMSTRSVPVRESPCSSVPTKSVPTKSLSSPCLAANGALSLLNLACYLLDRQVERLARDFEKEGGFTERLYQVRTANRRR